jgi:hypothetical protein
VYVRGNLVSMSAHFILLPTGSKFERWTVIKCLGTQAVGRQTATFYLCRCTCGTEAEVQRGNLVSGSSKSCGCLKREQARKRLSKPPGTAATNTVLDYYQRNAARRRLTWSLSREVFVRLIHESCCYCGADDSMESKKHLDVIKHNGVDRVDPSQGYTVSNCVPCCKTCNNAKAGMTPEQFFAWVERVYVSTQKRLTAKSAGA